MKIAICQMISDEHRYLDEWLRWHLSSDIAIDHIYLCEDVLSRSHKDITDKYNNVTLVDLCEYLTYEYKKIIQFNNKFYIQLALLGTAIHKLQKEGYDWLLFIDPDEYIEGNPREMLSRHLNDAVVSIKNICMTDNELFCDPPYEYSVVEKYKMKVRYQGSQNKVFINLKHELFKNGLDFYPVQTPHIITNHDVYEDNFECWHYLFKTWPEYIDRLTKRGQLSDSDWNRTLEEFFDANRHYYKYRRAMKNKLQKELPDFKVKVDAHYERPKKIISLLEQKQSEI